MLSSLTPTVTRGAARLATFAIVLLGLIATLPANAGAHGELVASSPTPGETVGSAVHIDLVFSTPVFEWSLTVERPDGEPLEGIAVEKAASYLSYETAPLTEEGQYIVRYTAIDSDSDVIEGAYAFVVEEGAPSPEELPVDLSVLIPDESLPLWNYAVLFAAVLVIAALAGLLAEKIRRLRAVKPAY